MAAPRDKLGEFILYAEEFNRYEEFARTSANYCWVDEAEPGATHPGEFEMKIVWGASEERRSLIRSDHVYGAARPIAQAVFDIACRSSHWTMSASGGGEAPVPPVDREWRIGVVVTPVLTDFDPSDTSWTDAYVAEGGFDFGAPAACELMVLDGQLIITPNDFPGPNNEPPRASASIDLAAAWPGLLVVKLAEFGPGWNGEEAIYGFELRVTTSEGSADASSASWEGGVSGADSVCFAILS